MANNIESINYQFNTPYANIDANYGPWSSPQEYETWYANKNVPGTPIKPGTLIAIHNQTTDEVTLKIYSKGTWVDVCSGNHDDEDESDDPSPTPPDPQPPETVTLVSIAVSGQTTSYQVGDTFSFDGTCTATYSDDSQHTVTPTSVSNPSMSTSGSKTITVSYTENGVTKTAKYTISVAAPVVKTASFTATLDANKYTQAKVGDTITYGVNLVNTGNVGITGGKIISTIKNTSNLAFALEAGHNTRLAYDYTVTQADVDNGTIHNEITVSANSAESGVANPVNVTTSKDITAIAASPSLTITKSANAPFTITTGTGIPYTITVKNTGNVTLASGVVADSKFVIPNNTFTSLVPGISKSFTYTYTTTQADVSAGKIENTATASNIIATRGTNPSSISATKTIIIPEPVTPVEPEPITPSTNHKYVDAMLPSGTLWATTNIGAEVETDLGALFAWGETQPKSSYSWSNYKYCNGTKRTLTKYCTNVNYWGGTGEIDNKIVLDPEDDPATVLWGPEWRMPTMNELGELFGTDSSKDYSLKVVGNTKMQGVQFYNGRGFKTIFIPIGILDANESDKYAYYWAKENAWSTDLAASALQTSARSRIFYAGIVNNQYRYTGMFVRPVYYKNKYEL